MSRPHFVEQVDRGVVGVAIALDGRPPVESDGDPDDATVDLLDEVRAAHGLA